MQATMPIIGARQEAAYAELERSVRAALETYANVHRGSGHFSVATTELYERARAIVLDSLGLDRGRYEAIFCTPRRAERLVAQVGPSKCRVLSSEDLGLPLGVRVLAVERRHLPSGAPRESGGGTARLVAPNWVIWSKAPDRFEPGTPPIVNVIAFARALQIVQSQGADAFRIPAEGPRAHPHEAARAILYADELQPLAGRALLSALRQTHLGRDVPVPTAQGMRPFINLDNGASTPTFAPIWEAVRRTWQADPAVRAALVEEVKTICAQVLGAPLSHYDVIFTANTTEAIDLLAEGLARQSGAGAETVVLNTLLEHNSNELPWRTTPGLNHLRLGVDGEGFMDLEELEQLLRAYNEEGSHGAQRIELVTVSGASNVLGVFNDLETIAGIVHRYGARLLVDGAQLVAHRPLDMEETGIDYLAFSAHKAYAPFGTGVLLARKGLPAIDPAEREAVEASGAENAGGIAALGKALLLLQRIGLDVIQEEESELTARLLRGLALLPRVTVHGIRDPQSPQFAHKGGVVIFDVNKKLPAAVAEALAVQGGIGVRSGCHCAHLLVKHILHIPAPLEQFQGALLRVLPKLSLPGVVRISLGIENSAEDVDALLLALAALGEGPKVDARHMLDGFAAGVAQEVFRPTPNGQAA